MHEDLRREFGGKLRMNRDDYLALLREALSNQHGVALEFEDWVEAEQARRRIYSLRDSLRRAGDDSFDILSLVMQPHARLLIVRRDRLPRHNMEDGLSAKSRLVRRDELPDKFGFANYAFNVSKPHRRRKRQRNSN